LTVLQRESGYHLAMISKVKSSLCLLPFFISWVSGLNEASGVLWSLKNCNVNGGKGVVYGRVTDAICCNSTSGSGNKCYQMYNRNDCDAEDTCRWVKSKNHPAGSCTINRDKKNNVCCQESDVKQNCVDMMAGKCPDAWQVPRDCCPAPYDKYAGVLRTDDRRSDLVCCNAPCQAIEKAWRGVEGNFSAGVRPVAPKSQCTAELSPNCAPAKRSYMGGMLSQLGLGGYGGYSGMDGGMGLGGYGGLGLGGDDDLLDMYSQLLGIPVKKKPKTLGKVTDFDGPDGGLTLAALKKMGYGSSKESHVEEITVDDFFDAIIDGLDNDKDVFEYNKEVNSDPWFGKQTFGGLNDGFNFVDPWKFISRIYGSKYGLQHAQNLYGMNYGISKNKFKDSKKHSTMTGFNYNPSPYGGMDLSSLMGYGMGGSQPYGMSGSAHTPYGTPAYPQSHSYPQPLPYPQPPAYPQPPPYPGDATPPPEHQTVTDTSTSAPEPYPQPPSHPHQPYPYPSPFDPYAQPPPYPMDPYNAPAPPPPYPMDPYNAPAPVNPYPSVPGSNSYPMPAPYPEPMPYPNPYVPPSPHMPLPPIPSYPQPPSHAYPHQPQPGYVDPYAPHSQYPAPAPPSPGSQERSQTEPQPNDFVADAGSSK